MTQADQIRQFAIDNYIAPARLSGRSEVVIRAGDVHREMGLAMAIPAVCSAIGANKFGELARANLVRREGPTNGANVYFHFSLVGSPATGPMNANSFSPPTAQPPRPVSMSAGFDVNSSITLISCVKSKLPHPAPARSLYTSSWFRKARDLVEGSGARWFVLSSRYCLVAPDATIAPYDYTLNTIGVAERREWARKVLDQLLPQLDGVRKVVMIAGHRYREFLVEPLERRGIEIVVPMAHFSRGEQLGWLAKHE
ncbi:MAG: DUF6884 domain-containing protein [Terriglobales bacterium]